MTIQDFQPYVSVIVQAAVGLLTVLILTGLHLLRQQTLAWLSAKQTDLQRGTLHRIAAEGFALAESTLGSGAGPWKLTAAAGYVANRLKQVGIAADPSEIRAAIEHAVLQYNAAVKPSSAAGAGAASTDAPARADAANRAG